MNTLNANAEAVKPRTADSIILEAVEAYREHVSLGNTHHAVYNSEDIFDGLTAGQKSSVARKLKSLGWTDYHAACFGTETPRLRFSRFVGRSCYGSEVSFPEPTPPADGPAPGTTADDHPQASPYVEAPDHGPEPTTRDLPEAAPARTAEQVAARLTNAVLALFEAEPGADTFRRWDLAMTVFSGLTIAEMDALASQLPKHLADDGFVGLAGWASFCQAGNVVRFPESPPISGPTPSRDSIDLGKRPGIWGPDGRGPAARRTVATFAAPNPEPEGDNNEPRPESMEERESKRSLVLSTQSRANPVQLQWAESVQGEPRSGLATSGMVDRIHLGLRPIASTPKNRSAEPEGDDHAEQEQNRSDRPHGGRRDREGGRAGSHAGHALAGKLRTEIRHHEGRPSSRTGRERSHPYGTPLIASQVDLGRHHSTVTTQALASEDRQAGRRAADHHIGHEELLKEDLEQHGLLNIPVEHYLTGQPESSPSLKSLCASSSLLPSHSDSVAGSCRKLCNQSSELDRGNLRDDPKVFADHMAQQPLAACTCQMTSKIYASPCTPSEVDLDGPFADDCGLQPPTRPATPSEGDDAPFLVEIAGTTYAVALHPRSVVLTKGNGESYEVMIEDGACSCPSHRYRHSGPTAPEPLGACKHTKALRRLHLIPTLILETV